MHQQSNNASLAGSWTPSVGFGIPGDSAAAIIIGVLYIRKICNLDQLFLFNPDKLYAVFIIFFYCEFNLITYSFLLLLIFKENCCY